VANELAGHIGSRHTARFPVTQAHTVPALPLSAAVIRDMPPVLSTPMLVAMAETACVEHLAALLGAAPLSVGISVHIEHTAATPVGCVAAVTTELTEAHGRLLAFTFTAHDGFDAIGNGRHQRALVPRQRFMERLAEKAARVSGGEPA
jgi:fluoroacetyl-CoA thioesterase